MRWSSSAVLGMVVLGGMQHVPAAPARQAEVVAAIQVHGNTATPEEEILEAAGVGVGDPFTPGLPAEAAARLRATGWFEGVDVRRRYASIADPTRIALVIIVDEHAVRILPPEVDEQVDPDAAPRVVRRGWFGSAMLLPLLSGEDGYGLTWGAMVAWPGVLGGDSRLAIPLTWGGHKRAGVEVERLVAGPQRIRLRAGGSLERRTNPFYEDEDARRRVWARAERATGLLRAGATVGWERIHFGADLDRFRSVGVDVTLDTRLDPGMPRNAVLARAAWTHYAAGRGPDFDVRTLAARGYLGLVGQSVVEARVDLERAGPGAARVFRPLLGGWSSVRGYRAGAFAGDTRALGSLELRVPLSSVLTTVRTGFSVFVDTGRAWDHGTRFDAAPLRTGYGAGLWLRAPLVHAGIAVAHGRGSGTRVNVGIGIEGF